MIASIYRSLSMTLMPFHLEILK